MSACGPCTMKRSRSVMALRICTPLLALSPLSRTLTFTSKSLYDFLLHRNVLNFTPSGIDEPTRAPSFTLQYAGSPSQPARSLALKNELLAGGTNGGGGLSSSGAFLF